MARIPMTSGFSLIPEGTYIFGIYAATYDETFGKIEVKLVTAKGLTHTERFSIKDKNDQLNEKALNAFSYFARTATGDWEADSIDPADLVGCYIEAEIVHTQVPSNRDPGKTVTFANLGEKHPATGFADEPSARALALLRGESAKPAPADKPAAAPAPATAPVPTTPDGGLDLDALLG